MNKRERVAVDRVRELTGKSELKAYVRHLDPFSGGRHWQCRAEEGQELRWVC